MTQEEFNELAQLNLEAFNSGDTSRWFNTLTVFHTARLRYPELFLAFIQYQKESENSLK